MTEYEALQEARAAATQRRLDFGPHARAAMRDGNANTEDVLHALLTATRAETRDHPKKWKFFGGKDFDGQDLEVVLDFKDTGPFVVTVM